jgi:hypothetical protein
MAEMVHSCGSNHLEGENRSQNGRFSKSSDLFLCPFL